MNQKICEKVKAIDPMLYCVTYFYLTKVLLEVAPLEVFLNETKLIIKKLFGERLIYLTE
jgi:hypothetical protein